MHIENCLSTEGIAKRLNETPAKVRHVINYRQIPDVGRLGGVRCFAPKAVEEVRAALAAMQPRRRRKPVTV